VPALDAASAVELFAARAAARVPGFALDAITAPIVARICEQLDGMPLAIELAAARLPLLTAAQIAERLGQSLPLLSARNAGLPARQRSLRATLDWSFSLLADAEKALFLRLAIFAGSFDLDAVEAVCGSSAALDSLQALVDAALVTIAARDEAGATRFRLHEVPRQYATAGLAAAGEADTYRGRHAAWAIALAERAAPNLGGEQQTTWLARLTLDHENLRAALAAAEQAGDAEAMLRLANALAQFWNAGAIGEGRDWLQRALGLAEGNPSPTTTSAWNNASFLAYRQGDYSAMRAAAATALGQALALEDAAGIADAHYRLAIHDEMQGQLAEARAHYRQSLDLYRQLGDQRGVGNILNGLAHVARLAGDLVAARGYYEQGLQLARAANDRRSTMLLLISLGNLLLDENWQGAQPLFAESLAHLRALGETSYLPYIANGLGECAYFGGNLSAAAAHYEEGLQAARSHKLTDMEGQLLLKLGDVATRAGDVARAADSLSESLRIYVRSGRTTRIVAGVYYCANLLARLGYPAQAVALFAAGLQAVPAADFGYVGGPEADHLAAAFAAAQAALPPAECAAALAAGRALSLQQAVGLALSAIHLPAHAEGLPAAELHIFTFGGLRVLRRGRELGPEEWVYGKTRELLLYLLHVEAASKEQIGAALWPEATPQQVRQNFRVAIYHLRRALGGADWIAFVGGRYAFNRALDYWHDEAAFAAAIAQAAHDPAHRAGHLQRAAELYAGDLALESLDSEALLVRREQLRQQAVDALLELGALRLAAATLPAAVAAYRRAIALDGYLEASHRGLLRALARQGERGAALAHYQALHATLRRDLAVEPDPATRALAEAIERGDAPEQI
jgi:DNA-binding SARP family transcriptional activator